MLNIIILTEPAKYTYHAATSNMIQSALQSDNHSVSVINIDSFQHGYECLNKINELQPDVLITLDLAGFSIRTQAGESALNMLLTKNLNLIWGNKAEYTEFLNKKISLSMLFYDATGTDHHLEQTYPNLLYYKVLGSINYFALESDIIANQKHFQEIWTDFLNDVFI